MIKHNLFNIETVKNVFKTEENINRYILSTINQRQAQMLIHSRIYYVYGTSVITDAKFDEWAKELVYMRKQYPKEALESKYNNRFINWDGTTGFHLETDDFDKKARWLIEKCKID